MTLESAANRNRYAGNGATRDFAFTFKAWKKDQVKVYVGDGYADTDVTSSCSVELTESGGTVSFPNAPAAGTVIVIKRQMPYLQEDDYRNGSRFDAEEIEDRFDMDCAERQDLRGDIARTVKMPETSSLSSEQFVEAIMSAAKEMQEAGDVAGASLVQASGAPEFRSISSRFGDFVNVRDFGAAGDGVTDDTAAFAAAAAAGKTVYVPQGSYSVSGSVSGSFVSDGLVDAGTVRVESIAGTAKNLHLLKTALSFCNPSQKLDVQDYLDMRQTGYYFQSVCYDSTRERFILGIENGDNEQAGYLYALSDLTDQTSVEGSTTVMGGHFNDLAYDAKNDKLYIAPGLTPYSNKLLTVNPSTFEIEDATWTMPDTVWQCSVDGDYVYVILSGKIERYITATKQKDESFKSIPVVAPAIALDEELVSQSSFIYDGVFVKVSNVKGSSALSYRRVVYSCYDLETGENVNTSFRLENSEELEGAVVKDGVLYQIAPSSNKMVVYVTPLGTIYTSRKYSGIVENDLDLDSYTTEGEYYISSATVYNSLSNAPAGVPAAAGTLFVLETAKTGRKIQLLVLSSGVACMRHVNVENGTVSDWAYPGFAASWISDADGSIDSHKLPGTILYSNIQDSPSGSTGFVVTLAGYGTSKIYKQFWLRWGTGGSSDHYIYERLGVYSGGTFTWYDWVKIITGKDSFPNNFIPETTNSYSLGESGRRWSSLWLTSGEITSSDRELKTGIDDPEEAVLRAWGRVRVRVFQFKDSVQEKGESARLHVGLIAQEVAEAFEAEGLDASRYGLFCYDEWDDVWDDDVVIDEDPVVDESGNVVAEAKTHVERKLVCPGGSQYSIRYTEALALECAYQRWRLEQIEARLASLEVQ